MKTNNEYPCTTLCIAAMLFVMGIITMNYGNIFGNPDNDMPFAFACFSLAIGGYLLVRTIIKEQML